MYDCLLIGIKDGKWTVLLQAGEPHIYNAAKKIKQKLGAEAFDKYIMVRGNLLNV